MPTKTDETAERAVVLITGASSGIGRATAVRFARKGWRVLASMRRPERGAELRAEAQAAGWALTTPALDVTSDSSVEGAVGDLLRDTGGRVDVLINNAGYYAFGPLSSSGDVSSSGSHAPCCRRCARAGAGRWSRSGRCRGG